MEVLCFIGVVTSMVQGGNMGIEAREKAGGTALDLRGCYRQRLLQIGGVLGALLGTPGCTNMGDIVVTDQALVTSGLELILEMDEVLLAWDVRINGRVNVPFCHLSLESDIDGRIWSGDGDS